MKTFVKTISTVAIVFGVFFAYSQSAFAGEFVNEIIVPANNFQGKTTVVYTDYNPLDFTRYFKGSEKKEASNSGQLLVNDPNTVSQASAKDRSDFKNSASNDDRLGEKVALAGSRRNAMISRNSNRTALSASVVNSGLGQRRVATTTTNYGTLLIIVVMLVVIAVLARITLRKRRDVDYHKSAYLPRTPQPVYVPQQAAMRPQR